MNPQDRRHHVLTVGFAGAATLAGGLLAGLNVNRALVEMPAWQHTGAIPWANFSRHADLSTVGALFYAIGAFAGAILSIGTALSFRGRSHGQPHSAAIPIYGAVPMAIGGLLITTQAAPIMIGVRDLGDDAMALQQALNGFQFWGNIRGVFQVLAFVANLWSLVALTQAAVRPGLCHVPPSATRR
jgi:hypothetical protein